MRKYAVLVALACIVELVGCASVSSVSAVKATAGQNTAAISALDNRVGIVENKLTAVGVTLAAPAVSPVSPESPAIVAAPNAKPKPVVEAYHMALFWVVILCIVAFVIGVLANGVFEALEPAMDAKMETEEMGLLGGLQKLVHNIWAGIFGKKKTTATAKAS